jgi:hypothetical protein
MEDEANEAIQFLRQQDVNSNPMFEECAYVIECLLNIRRELEDKIASLEAPPASAYRRGMSFGAESWYKRNRQRSFSPAMDDAE